MPTANKAIRDRHRTAVRSRRDPCHICGHPIDYTLAYPHPGSFVVDHVVPTSRGGADTLANAQAAHAACNRAKSDHDQPAPTGATITTTRTWWTQGGATPPAA